MNLSRLSILVGDLEGDGLVTLEQRDEALYVRLRE